VGQHTGRPLPGRALTYEEGAVAMQAAPRSMAITRVAGCILSESDRILGLDLPNYPSITDRAEYHNECPLTFSFLAQMARSKSMSSQGPPYYLWVLTAGGKLGLLCRLRRTLP
jgi:hypothetical protein